MEDIFTDDTLIAANIQQRLAIAATHNVLAIANDKQNMANWCRNAPLYKAAGMAVPPQPDLPEIWTVDPAKVRSIIVAYNAKVQSGEPAGELDFDPSVSKALYVRPVPAGPAVVGRPADPLLGTVIGKGQRALMPGDDFPIGEKREKDGDTWIKTEGNNAVGGDNVHPQWWERQ